MGEVVKTLDKKQDVRLPKIQENLFYIKENIGKLDRPIIIEFTGTPKSGKTTLVNNLQDMFVRCGIPVNKKRETAEYNPIEDKTIEEYNLWMIMELMKNTSEDLASHTPQIIIYDRGVLDRIPWIRTSVEDGSFPKEDVKAIEGLYSTKFMSKYKPITYGFYTSPEISILRKGKPGRLVNEKTLGMFNKNFTDSEGFFKRMSQRYTHIDTDEYQGRLSDFILDIMEKVTDDTKRTIEEQLKAKEVRTSNDDREI